MTRKRPVLSQLNLVVRDMDAAVDFYRRLGIEFPDTLPDWQAHHRTADLAGEVSIDFGTVS